MIAHSGLKNSRHRIKLLTQWMMSYGIPAIHQVMAILHPPMNKYGIEQIYEHFLLMTNLFSKLFYDPNILPIL